LTAGGVVDRNTWVVGAGIRIKIWKCQAVANPDAIAKIPANRINVRWVLYREERPLRTNCVVLDPSWGAKWPADRHIISHCGVVGATVLVGNRKQQIESSAGHERVVGVLKNGVIAVAKSPIPIGYSAHT